MMRTILIVTAFFTGGSALAQNTGGVFGPRVNEGHRAAEYRLTLDEPFDDLSSGWAQRVHYESALNGDLMWRAVGQVRERAGETRGDFLRGELFWDVAELRPGWHTGFRFDAMVRSGSAPDQLGVHWTNEFTLGPRTFARFVALSALQVGDRGSDSILFETRAMMAHRLENGVQVGIEAYDPWGPIDSFSAFRASRHQVGPFAVWPVGGVDVFTGALLGASESAPDLSLRLRVVKRL